MAKVHLGKQSAVRLNVLDAGKPCGVARFVHPYGAEDGICLRFFVADQVEDVARPGVHPLLIESQSFLEPVRTGLRYNVSPSLERAGGKHQN